MIKSKFPGVKAVILDMDGVLWKGTQPIGNLPAIFSKFDQLELKVILATNNSTGTPEIFQEKLKKFGVHVEADQIVNSSMAAAYVLSKKFPQGGPVYVVGEIGVTNALKEYGFFPSEESVIAVVVGMDWHFTYHSLAKAALLIRNGATYIATNHDATYPTPEGLMPGAGAVNALVTSASGVQPVFAGKPHATMMNMILERLKLSPQEILVVGDRLDTDIASGQNASCHTALVLSGVSTREEAEMWNPTPELIVPDLSALVEI